jgi:hypothetical protein
MRSSSLTALSLFLFGIVVANDLLMLQRYEDLSNNCYGNTTLEYRTSIAAGYSVKVATDAEWNAMTTADFAGYRAIVIPDCCISSLNDYDILEDTKNVWSAAINKNIILLGSCFPALPTNN